MLKVNDNPVPYVSSSFRNYRVFLQGRVISEYANLLEMSLIFLVLVQ